MQSLYSPSSLVESIDLTGCRVVSELLIWLDKLDDVVSIWRGKSHGDTHGPIVVNDHVPRTLVKNGHLDMQFLYVIVEALLQRI